MWRTACVFITCGDFLCKKVFTIFNANTFLGTSYFAIVNNSFTASHVGVYFMTLFKWFLLYDAPLALHKRLTSVGLFLCRRLFAASQSAHPMLFIWHNSLQWVMASSFKRFLDHTQRRTTVGRTPLNEWSARRRDLYLTTHDIHNRQISMPQVGLEPTIPEGEKTYALDYAATGTHNPRTP